MRSRLFVGVFLPDEWRERLALMCDAIRDAEPAWRDVKWVPEENLHVTLAFLGDVEEQDVPALCDRLSAVAARTRRAHPPARRGAGPPVVASRPDDLGGLQRSRRGVRVAGRRRCRRLARWPDRVPIAGRSTRTSRCAARGVRSAFGKRRWTPRAARCAARPPRCQSLRLPCVRAGLRRAARSTRPEPPGRFARGSRAIRSPGRDRETSRVSSTCVALTSNRCSCRVGATLEGVSRIPDWSE